MFDEALSGGAEASVSETQYRQSSPVEIGLRVAEKVRDSRARIERQMSKLPVQAEQWRTAATELNVNGALNSDPKIQSAMFGIADRYVRMAYAAEIGYRLALAERSFPAGGVGREAAFPAGRGSPALPGTPTTLQHNDFSANERAGFGPDPDPFPAVSHAAGKTPNSKLSPACLHHARA